MANYFYDTNLKITKFNIAKDGELKDLEINGQDIELGGEVVTKLYAWKYSSSYIYTKKLPTVAGSTPIITQNPMADASGTYAPATSAVTHDIWKIGSSFYNDDCTSATEPAGTAGTPVDIGDAIIASDTKMYSGADSVYYQVLGFTDSELELDDTAVTDADLITELDAATASEVDYIEYTEAATTEGITYSGNKYARQSDKDYTI